MIDLSTQYLGLNLKNPLVPSSSPLSKHLDSARRLEDAGAAALVMHSLFEEKIEEEDAQLARFFHQQSLGHGEAESFHPVPETYLSYEEKYLEHLAALKGSLAALRREAIEHTHVLQSCCARLRLTKRALEQHLLQMREPVDLCWRRIRQRA